MISPEEGPGCQGLHYIFNYSAIHMVTLQYVQLLNVHPSPAVMLMVSWKSFSGYGAPGWFPHWWSLQEGVLVGLCHLEPPESIPLVLWGWALCSLPTLGNQQCDSRILDPKIHGVMLGMDLPGRQREASKGSKPISLHCHISCHWIIKAGKDL